MLFSIFLQTGKMILQNVHSRLQAGIWTETLFNDFLSLYFFCIKCPMKSDFTKALTLIPIHNQFLFIINFLFHLTYQVPFDL